ncbi:MAG: CBS domain-containing protein [Gammaproteobacteria bacterium]|nr:MAG: CBS domain-containing protein [Gammaproteobacteria bacterium]
MKVSTILKQKGDKVYTISPDATLRDMVREMLALHIGSLLVMDEEGDLAGIVTERDLLRNLAKLGADWEKKTIGEVMNTEVYTGTPEETIDEVMHRMTEHRIRHLPVVEHGKVVGMLSMGDIIKAALDETTFQNKLMKRYIKNWPEEE